MVGQLNKGEGVIIKPHMQWRYEQRNYISSYIIGQNLLYSEEFENKSISIQS